MPRTQEVVRVGQRCEPVSWGDGGRSRALGSLLKEMVNAGDPGVSLCHSRSCREVDGETPPTGWEAVIKAGREKS